MSPFNVLKWLMVLRGIVKARRQPKRGLALEAKRRAAADLLDYAGLTGVDADLRARQRQAGEMNTLRYQIQQQTPYNSLRCYRPTAFDLLRHQIKQNQP